MAKFLSHDEIDALLDIAEDPGLRPGPITWPTKAPVMSYAEGTIFRVGEDEIQLKDIVSVVKMMKSMPEFSAAFV